MIINLMLCYTSKLKKNSQISVKTLWRHWQPRPNGCCVQSSSFYSIFVVYHFFVLNSAKIGSNVREQAQNSHPRRVETPKIAKSVECGRKSRKLKRKHDSTSGQKFSSLRRQAIYSICSRSRKEKRFSSHLGRSNKRSVHSTIGRMQNSTFLRSGRWQRRANKKKPWVALNHHPNDLIFQSSSQTHAREWRK